MDDFSHTCVLVNKGSEVLLRPLITSPDKWVYVSSYQGRQSWWTFFSLWWNWVLSVPVTDYGFCLKKLLSEELCWLRVCVMQSKGGLDLEGDDELSRAGSKLSSPFLELVLSYVESWKVRLAVRFSDFCPGTGRSPSWITGACLLPTSSLKVFFPSCKCSLKCA